jgi:hypothetical protein
MGLLRLRAAKLKEKEKACSLPLQCNNILAPEAFSARFDSDILSEKRGKLSFVVSAIDYFFL